MQFKFLCSCIKSWCKTCPWPFMYVLSVATFMSATTELCTCNRNCMTHKSKTFTSWPFMKKNSLPLICKENLTRSILCLETFVGVFQRPHSGWSLSSTKFLVQLKWSTWPTKTSVTQTLPTSLVPSFANLNAIKGQAGNGLKKKKQQISLIKWWTGELECSCPTKTFIKIKQNSARWKQYQPQCNCLNYTLTVRKGHGSWMKLLCCK